MSTRGDISVIGDHWITWTRRNGRRPGCYPTPSGWITGEDLQWCRLFTPRERLWHKAPRWEVLLAVGRDYVAGIPLATIERRHGVIRKTIYRFVKRLGLGPRPIFGLKD